MVENPTYLWVVDPFGRLLGLMKGPYPRDHLQRGHLAAARWNETTRLVQVVVFAVRQWRRGSERWYVLELPIGDVTIDDLKTIHNFR